MRKERLLVRRSLRQVRSSDTKPGISSSSTQPCARGWERFEVRMSEVRMLDVLVHIVAGSWRCAHMLLALWSMLPMTSKPSTKTTSRRSSGFM
jgi:hypothetical protein